LKLRVYEEFFAELPKTGVVFDYFLFPEFEYIQIDFSLWLNLFHIPNPTYEMDLHREKAPRRWGNTH